MLLKIEETEWYQKLMAYDCILIFGATFGARLTCQLMKAYYVEPDCFIVSERRDNPFFLEQKPVKVFDEIEEKLKQNALVIISQRYESTEAMKLLLFKAGFKNTIPSIVQDTSAVTEELSRYRESILGPIQMVPKSKENSLQPAGLICVFTQSHPMRISIKVIGCIILTMSNISRREQSLPIPGFAV